MGPISKTVGKTVGYLQLRVQYVKLWAEKWAALMGSTGMVGPVVGSGKKVEPTKVVGPAKVGSAEMVGPAKVGSTEVVGPAKVGSTLEYPS